MNKKQQTIALSKILFPASFKKTMPRREKIESLKAHIQKTGTLDQTIIVHPKTNMLVDGFARYLAAKELGLKEVPVQFGTKKRPSKKPPKKHRPKAKISDETRLAIWEAEDGRCEVCKRAMDKRFARWLPVNPAKIEDKPEDLHLACIDCSRNQPEYLRTFIRVDKSVMKKIEQKTEYDNELEFVNDFREHAVIVGKNKEFRTYWLPGIGSFLIKTLDEKENGLPVREVFQAKSIKVNGKLKIKPQERTRGFKRPVLQLS
ncbi:ParB/Srx family N-terminal domain-containing protein [Thermoactinomyces sp. CICC 10522]|uniref:ParB/Srx family N-terminal domain-containing protein n=1 Tax=Thermoactinomyces sp. CICC 10522 TaxID=2767427 RepID=UPI0018DCC515|nr:ParB/Srx family N-terminal domain-containing protein [Thermoactinomyces sp. CICC 10522]MBH8605615.1 ParB N-terminal domain-containing protein [Thermoactinomyces sp. CICC 10522]